MPPPSPAQQSSYGASVALSAGTSSTRVALTANVSIFPVIQVINDGANAAYVVAGSNTVVATTANLQVAPGESQTFAVISTATNVAGITASGTAALRIIQWNGGPNYNSRGVLIENPSGSPIPVVNPPITMVAGDNNTIVTGGTAVAAIIGPANGGYIYNPPDLANMGTIAAVEDLFVDPVTTATTTGNGTNAALPPGAPWVLPGPIAAGTTISANAATSGHKFTSVKW